MSRNGVIEDVDAVDRSKPARLSADYNVLVLDAPGDRGTRAPGQFVMIQPLRGLDPLLRRPFSIFEIVRKPAAGRLASRIFNKRIGVGTSLLSHVEAGASAAGAGPAGPAVLRRSIRPPRRGWSPAASVWRLS